MDDIYVRDLKVHKQRILDKACIVCAYIGEPGPGIICRDCVGRSGEDKLRWLLHPGLPTLAEAEKELKEKGDIL